MQQSAYKMFQGFSIVELMAVISIIAILAVVAVPSYRAYTIKASIGAAIPVADKVKSDIEADHNQGVIFGNTTGSDYLSSITNKPDYVLSLTREAYGCIAMELSTEQLGLDANQAIVLAWCPTTLDDMTEWTCGYGSATDPAYLQYLPSNCQTPIASMQDTAW